MQSGSASDILERDMGRQTVASYQITQKTYVMFIGSCQPASMGCKTHFFSSCCSGNSILSYQFTRCVVEAVLGAVLGAILPPCMVLHLGNAPSCNSLFIVHSGFQAERTALPLVTRTTVSVSWTRASCDQCLLSSCEHCVCTYAYLGLCLNIEECVQTVSAQKCGHVAKKKSMADIQCSGDSVVRI